MADDIRMRGFAKRSEPGAALEILAGRIRALPCESVSISRALDRVLAEDVVAELDVPMFDRSAMDGYAVRAKDTFGASATNALGLRLRGSTEAGARAGAIRARESIRIMTGAPMPAGSDAVVMAEHAEERGGMVMIMGPVTPGKNVSLKGEDIRSGQVVMSKGALLRPQHIGVLASVGKTEVPVHRRPGVAIISTGNELVPAGGLRSAYQTVDSNSHILACMTNNENGIPVFKGIVKDRLADIKEALAGCSEDIIVVTGGTSVGRKDFVPLAVEELGELAVHGVAVRPGAPTGIGFIRKRPVFLLPGNPVGAMVGFELFAAPAIQMMQGLVSRRRAVVQGRLKRKIASEIGRTDFVRVRLGSGVEPVRSGGSGILSSMTRADGFVIVPSNKEGLNEGEMVEVRLF